MTRRISIGAIEDFPRGQIRQAGAHGTVVLVARLADGTFCAVLDECSHMALPIGQVPLEGTTITCPHHRSQFDICTGQNLDWVRLRGGITLPRWIRRLADRGETPRPLTTVPVIVEGDTVYVEVE